MDTGQSSGIVSTQVELVKLAEDLEKRAGNATYQAAWKIAARIIRDRALKLIKN